MALDVTEFIRPDEAQIKAIADASAAKAESYRVVREDLAVRFKDNKRVGLETLVTYCTEREQEYREASDPAYWTK
jgi:hypothetical protein